ncbi:MAG: hypothetical protein KDD47_12320 [Acidobacteria bacterium]|nr:hypothetical protein [Acidobacteriota bacterium]
MNSTPRRALWILACFVWSVATLQTGALEPPAGHETLRSKAFSLADFHIPDAAEPVSLLPAQASQRAEQRLSALGITANGARVDRRGGRFETLLPSHALTAAQRAPGRSLSAHGEDARAAFRSFLSSHRTELGIGLAELSSGRATVYGDGSVVSVHLQRVIDGVPVRGSYVHGVINHGKLNLYAARHWGDVHVSLEPQITASSAYKSATEFLAPHTLSGSWGKDQLLLIPTAKTQGAQEVGNGYGHRLVWQLHPTFDADRGTWELLVDAATGEVVSFVDTNQYAEIRGGVLPVTNDGIVPDGVEQAGWPMPFVDVQTGSGILTSDTGGNVAATGSMTSSLAGPYVRINDNCGAISLTQSDGIDFGTSGGTDCTTPGFGGTGNTHASRTGFYELNKIIEMARGQLPANVWLQQQLTSNMNINQTCNAFWNGTVNFYRSGGGCSNTGEIAGVFDHEWGHGMDANDATPGIASPSGEGIADVYTALRLNDSCIGRNFRPGINCSGNGDPCIDCTGVRDIDYLQRASGQPHTYTWSNANCGGSVHCIGGTYSEAVWSLWKRDLQGAPYNLDDHTAHEIVNRLTFIGAGNTGTWFSGGPPNGGCSATNGYMNYLAADDDNGNLNDGTPHMTAIFNAFNRQEIACATPTVQDSGCAGTPTAAATVTATALDKEVNLSWTPVAGASSYAVFRTEGVFACDFGKVRLGETSGTTWNDPNLQNGRDYSYIVIPKGANAACFGSASSCATASPAAGPNLAVDVASAQTTIDTGDGDTFLDNCESATMTFDVVNTGLGTLTNVRIVDVVSTSHPATTVATAFPAAISPSTLGEDAAGTGSFQFTAGGLSFGDTLVFQVEVTADELGSGKLQDLSLTDTESDLQNFASRTFTFEADAEGWVVQEGTFNRTATGGGAQASAWYEASSSNLDNQCDHIRSPAFQLNSDSTLSVWTNFDVEPQSSPGVWWDRANFGVYEVATGTRNLATPDGGRLYNASGANGNCGTTGQGGWADTAATWAESTFSAGALGSTGLAGELVQLDLRYGTDTSVVGTGFTFDQVTLTNVDFQVADSQNDSCVPECTLDSECDDGLFCNGAETCNGGSCQAGSDPCPGQGCDESGDACVPLLCDDDGVCESGEDCGNCPGDCPTFPIPGAACGNGVCEAGNGENCLTCAADCNGKQNGNPAGRFCCGDGGGENPVSCGDARCSTSGFSCTTVPQPGGSSCCGDLLCEGGEDGGNCAIDCGACDIVETSCTNGTDDDCDGFVDCDDADCSGAPVCQTGCTLGQKGDPCSSGAQCCSGSCKPNGTCR